MASGDSQGRASIGLFDDQFSCVFQCLLGLTRYEFYTHNLSRLTAKIALRVVVDVHAANLIAHLHSHEHGRDDASNVALVSCYPYTFQTHVDILYASRLYCRPRSGADNIRRMRMGGNRRRGLISITSAFLIHPDRSNTRNDGVLECHMRA